MSALAPPSTPAPPPAAASVVSERKASLEVVHPAVARKCTITGDGMHTAIANKSRLLPLQEAPVINQPCELLLEAIDKYGNKLDRGGARVDARASGPGVGQCEAKDRGDGTYTITFTAGVVGETRVTVRLDNVEMPALKLVFVAPTDGGGKGKKAAATDVKAEAPAPAPVEAS